MEICQGIGHSQLFSNHVRFRHSPVHFGRRGAHALSFRRFSLAAFANHGSETVSEPNRMFILGMGFVGQFFGQHLLNHNWVVSGTCTSPAKMEKLEEKGFDMHLFSAYDPDLPTLDALKYHTHLLVSIPPVVGVGDPMLQHWEILRNMLTDGNIQWLCYLSSTRVYGDCDGKWVDEDYHASPRSELAKLRLAAEEGWLNLGFDLGITAQVFRLGGIYGPGRSAIHTIIKQEPLSEGQKSRASRQYTSRVHVEDICQALYASIHTASCGRIYNVVDDDPAPREEVFAYAQELVEKKWPCLLKPKTPGSEEPRMQKGGSRGEKRVSNARMKKELGVKLLHPSYRSGLQSIIDNLKSPGQRIH